MLQLNFIRENKELLLSGLKKRNFGPEAESLVDKVIETDEARRQTQKSLDDILSESNQLSKEIGSLFKSGKREEAEQLKKSANSKKEISSQLQEKLNSYKSTLDELLLSLPNMPNELVPPGLSEEDNEVYQAWESALPELSDEAIPHWELAKKYDIFDLELGTKLTGAGFPVFRKKGARLQRALINFFLDEAHKAGYEEIVAPLLVNEASGRGTGSLPDKEGQMYYVEKDDLYLIPTAELPITNIYRGDILSPKELPIKMCGYTPCFRREAGSYGAHVRGLNRVHQFDKIEIVQIAHPDNSYDILNEMLSHVAGLLRKLELPFRILRLCGADLTFASALTYDFEVYSAAQKRWLEVSSVSNFETFQSNRMKLRYRDDDKKLQLAHTLNGSALALARIIAALLENNQEAEGIRIPKILIPYTGFEFIN